MAATPPLPTAVAEPSHEPQSHTDMYPSQIMTDKQEPNDTDHESSSSYADAMEYHYSDDGTHLSGDAVTGPAPLLALPAELIDMIIRNLSPWETARMARTCKHIRGLAMSETLWQSIVQANIPGVQLESPAPFKSYFEMYAEHDPAWLLPKHKIWFCDHGLTGKFVIVRYCRRRGCIEGMELLAQTPFETTAQPWDLNPTVAIQPYTPTTFLHLDKPILNFKMGDRKATNRGKGIGRGKTISQEITMVMDDRFHNMFSNLILTKPLDDESAKEKLATTYPYDHIWPPPTIPASEHIVCSRAAEQRRRPSRPVVEMPQLRDEVGDKTFRIRRWMEMLGTSVPVRAMLDRAEGPISRMPRNLVRPEPIGVHMGEDVMTYSTLDPKLYTPTPTKPWRGIWVGDYSSHGSEFLLFHQPDDEPATDEELNLHRWQNETDEDWEQRRLDARIYRGRLEAVKLTGDVNVPRGEFTFYADDLGPGGTINQDPGRPFEGVKMIRTKGHLANTGFQRDKFVDTQLFLIGHNRVAQYWPMISHISYFERVDIDSHLNPETAPCAPARVNGHPQVPLLAIHLPPGAPDPYLGPPATYMPPPAPQPPGPFTFHELVAGAASGNVGNHPFLPPPRPRRRPMQQPPVAVAGPAPPATDDEAVPPTENHPATPPVHGLPAQPTDDETVQPTENHPASPPVNGGPSQPTNDNPTEPAGEDTQPT